MTKQGKSSKANPGMTDVEEGDTRDVTPDNPLIINETSVTYDSVAIKGGQIYCNVETTVRFIKLQKVS